MALIGWLIVRIALGVATKMLNEERGHRGGFWWGIILGVIGLIIVIVRKEGNATSDSQKENNNGEGLFERLAREKREEDAKHTRLGRGGNSSGSWICPRCGTNNPNYVGTCGCGQYSIHVDTTNYQSKPKIKKDDELVNQKKLYAYKELLDNGIITQEDYDKKKTELIR